MVDSVLLELIFLTVYQVIFDLLKCLFFVGFYESNFYLGETGIEISYKGDGREYKLNLAKSDSDWNLNQWTFVLPKTNILTTLFSE